MNFRFLSMIAAVSLVAACSTTQDTTGGADSGGAQPMTETSAPSQPVMGESQKMVEKTLSEQFFDFDKSDLKPEGRVTLRKWAVWLRVNPDVALTVEGHCDERGTREYNLALGERRANAVKEYLISQGVGADRIRTISYGEERPADPRSNEEAWAQNRRSVGVLMAGGAM